MPIAIDIGTRALHLVQGQAGKSTVNIRQAVIEPLPSGLVQDGIIREFGGQKWPESRTGQKPDPRQKLRHYHSW